MMAGQRQVEAASHAISRDSGIDRGREAVYGIHQSLPHLGEFIGGRPPELRDLFQFRACGKESVVAREYNRPNVPRELTDGIGQRQHTLARQTVSPIVRLQPHDAHVFALLNLKRSCRHRGKSSKNVSQKLRAKSQKPKAKAKSYPLRSTHSASRQPSSSSRNVPTPKHSPTMRCDSGSRPARVIHCCPTRYCAAVNHFCGNTSTRPACG